MLTSNQGPGQQAKDWRETFWQTYSNQCVNLKILFSGTLGTLCRHRAVLFKLICDEIGLPCMLVRGMHLQTPHVWNAVWNESKSDIAVIDCFHKTDSLYIWPQILELPDRRVRKFVFSHHLFSSLLPSSLFFPCCCCRKKCSRQIHTAKTYFSPTIMFHHFWMRN